VAWILGTSLVVNDVSPLSGDSDEVNTSPDP
jgi:hypothetical protein